MAGIHPLNESWPVATDYRRPATIRPLSNQFEKSLFISADFSGIPPVSPNRSHSGGRAGDYAASHQRSWLRGHHAVLETLTAGRWPVIELFADPQLPPDVLQRVRVLAAQQQIPVQLAESRRLEQLCRHSDHQGLLARMGEFPWESLTDLAALLSVAANSQRTKVTNGSHRTAPLFVLCDRLQDAHNFGAILRCCDAVHVDGIVTGEREQVSVTPHVARASSGAVNHLRLFRGSSTTEALRLFRAAGYQVLAASEKASTQLWQASLQGPQVLVIGSEAHGIAQELLELCHLRIAIPMLGRVSSLNAAVAAGILLYECRRQQALAP